jgi:hypothetical protein
MHVSEIFCDSAEAFDCVNHEILLPKLNFYGNQGSAGQWFKSDLNGRKQSVEIKSPKSNSNSYSNWGIVKHGVPQGSILGSLSFLLYINDLPQIINSQSKPILFTDDISIIIYHPDSDYFQNSINVFASLNKRFKANKLTLNFDKINFMKFATNRKTCINLNIGY